MLRVANQHSSVYGKNHHGFDAPQEDGRLRPAKALLYTYESEDFAFQGGCQ